MRNAERTLPALLALALACLACDATETDDARHGTPAGGDAPKEGHATRDLVGYGEELGGAVEIHPGIWQARGTANAQMVVTGEGNVVFDTGLLNQPRVQDELLAVDDGPVTHLVLSHAHADHYSAAGDFIQDGTEVIAHPEFLHNQRYLKELAPTLMARNAIFFPEDTPAIPGVLMGAMKLVYPTVEPTRLVVDRHEFSVGGRRFEVIALPGAEGSDGLVLWMPEERILFTGDFFGHIFPMWPNLVTIRGERPRFPKPYVDSLDLVLELDPEILVPSHFEPIVGKDRIREGVTRTRDAVAWVEQAVIDGINDGKDVHALMREIRLPDRLAIPEVHGKVSWGVRSIYEAYLGWFRLRSSAELYGVAPWAVHAEVVEMAGGPDAVAERAARHLEQGRPVEALHLVDMALEASPRTRSALEVRLGALDRLLEAGDEVNHYETMWLKHRIRETRKALGTASG